MYHENARLLVRLQILCFVLSLTGATTDRLITSKDHASVQIMIADVDANGRALTTSTSFALSGQVRSQGESDDSINRLATQEGCTYHHFSLHRVRFSHPVSAPQCLVILQISYNMLVLLLAFDYLMPIWLLSKVNLDRSTFLICRPLRQVFET